MKILNSGRYIHQTLASHASSILKFLSTAQGTEQGIFDFDVPIASYTISVSNRIYGSPELHAGVYGARLNYTYTGANPLLVHGNLRIVANVSMSVDQLLVQSENPDEWRYEIISTDGRYIKKRNFEGRGR